eukprot:TRINITY_DN18371_c0_g1_i1.p1 TRINITY_DN18371_c0_g1~~TRINITY_DN18371_c0_g1_i1.p1  ORF type:complete len:500 (-),score=34.85 TRINITY_DN18371_c0_g1_i1:7-1506(-)
MASRVTHVESNEEFDVLLESAGDSLVVVDFFATWCGPCKAIAPVLDRFSLQYPNVVFLKVDVDQLQETAQKHQVTAMPTFKYFKNGAVVFEFKGASVDQLERAIQTFGGTLAPPAPSAPSLNLTYLPQKECVFFNASKLDVVVAKILATNAKLVSEQPSLFLDVRQAEKLENIQKTLMDTSFYHTSSFSTAEYEVVGKLLHWPTIELFPVFDLLRLMVLHPAAAEAYGSGKQNLHGKPLLTFVLENLQPSAPVPNQLMLLRLLANAFKNYHLRKLLLECFLQVTTMIAFVRALDVKPNLRPIAATILLNYAVHFSTPPFERDFSSERRALANILLEAIPLESDEETQLRLIVALGTLALESDDVRTMLQPLLANLQAIADKLPHVKCKQAAAEALAVSSGKAFAAAAAAPTTASIPLRPAAIPTTSPSSFPTPGMPGMPAGIDPQMFQKIMQSPALLSAMQNPNIMAKLQEIMADPSKLMSYAQDPEVMQLMQAFKGLM